MLNQVDPSFNPDPVEQEVMPGKPITWSIPVIVEGSHSLQSISMVTDAEISAFITLNSADKTVSYDGAEASKVLGGQSFSLSLTLQNILGDTYTASQAIKFVKPVLPSLLPEPRPLNVKV